MQGKSNKAKNYQTNMWVASIQLNWIFADYAFNKHKQTDRIAEVGIQTRQQNKFTQLQ